MTELRDMSFTQVLNEYIADMRAGGSGAQARHGFAAELITII